MSIIHMETDQVRELISRMDRTASEFLERAGSLSSVGPALSTAWQGGASAEFITEMDGVTRNYQIQAQALDSLARRLARELEEWEQADSNFEGSGPIAVEISFAHAGWFRIPIGIQVFTGQEALMRTRLPLTNQKIRIIGVGPIRQWNQSLGRPQPGSVASRPQQVQSVLDRAVDDLAASMPDAAVNKAARDSVVSDALIGKDSLQNRDSTMARLRLEPKPPVPPARVYAGAASNSGKPGAQVASLSRQVSSSSAGGYDLSDSIPDEILHPGDHIPGLSDMEGEVRPPTRTDEIGNLMPSQSNATLQSDPRSAFLETDRGRRMFGDLSENVRSQIPERFFNAGTRNVRQDGNRVFIESTTYAGRGENRSLIGSRTTELNIISDPALAGLPQSGRIPGFGDQGTMIAKGNLSQNTRNDLPAPRLAAAASSRAVRQILSALADIRPAGKP